MNARLRIAAGVLAVVAPWGAQARPVPGPADAGADGRPLTALAPPRERAPQPPVPPDKVPSPTQLGVLMPADRPTIQKLHDANQLEIQLGHLAEQRGASRGVKNLGHQLVADHTAADKKLDAFLRKRGSSLTELATTGATDADHELLATRTGREFDRAFGLQLVADHTRTIEMLQSARISTFDDLLRDLYDEVIETQETHKRAAQDVIASAARS
jgi:putative membrane protein